MNLPRPAWLHHPALRYGTPLVLCAGLLLYSLTERQAAARALLLAETRLEQSRLAVRTLQQDVQADQAALAQWTEAHSAGWPIEPDRQAWGRHVHRVLAQQPGQSLDWEIVPPHPLDLFPAPPPPSEQTPRQYSVALHLHGRVVHEGQLLPLLPSDPPAPDEALVLTRRCTLNRAGEDKPDPDKPPGGLQVDCRLERVFLRPPTPSR